MTMAMTMTNCIAVIAALAISGRSVSAGTADSALCTQEPSSWCCQLAGGDTCVAYGTKRMLARICSAYPNNGIDCATCPGAADSPHCSLAPTPPPPTPNATNYAGRGSLLLASFSEGHANYATWSTSASKVPSFTESNFSVGPCTGECPAPGCFGSTGTSTDSFGLWNGFIEQGAPGQKVGYARVDAKLGLLGKDVSRFEGIEIQFAFKLNPGSSFDIPQNTYNTPNIKVVLKGGGVLGIGAWEYAADLGTPGDVIPTNEPIYSGFISTCPVAPGDNHPNVAQSLWTAYVPFSAFTPLSNPAGSAPSRLALSKLRSVGLAAPSQVVSPWGQGNIKLLISSISASKGSPGAPTPAPSDNHLWFRYVDGSSNCETGYCRCGEVDAASRMPASLFKPDILSKYALKAYTALTLAAYSTGGSLSRNTTLELGRCAEIGFTCKQSRISTGWDTGADLMGPICKKQCDCTYPQCPDAPDQPLLGKYCSLCGPKFNANYNIQLWNLPNQDDDYVPPAGADPACY